MPIFKTKFYLCDLHSVPGDMHYHVLATLGHHKTATKAEAIMYERGPSPERQRLGGIPMRRKPEWAGRNALAVKGKRILEYPNRYREEA